MRSRIWLKRRFKLRELLLDHRVAGFFVKLGELGQEVGFQSIDGFEHQGVDAFDFSHGIQGPLEAWFVGTRAGTLSSKRSRRNSSPCSPSNAAMLSMASRFASRNISADL